MNTNRPILECVPNFSEGRDEKTLAAIAASIQSVPGVMLLHTDSSPAANRTVMTFAGEPEAVIEAAFLAIKTAAELIDMRCQTGVHPRIGSTDVCPLVPLYNMTMAEAVGHSHALGKRVGRELGIPVYMYEHSAAGEHRRALPDIRRGQYEGFAEKIRLANWTPDYGSGNFTPHCGATVIGARDVLVAFNISLDTPEVEKANYIAARIRERGYINLEGEEKVRVRGLLPKVRAIGWFMEDYQSAQVSMNLLDYKVSSPLQAFEACESLAHEIGVRLTGSEVIGLIPESCLLEAGSFACMREQQEVPDDHQLLIHYAIELLGLNHLKPFEPQEKVLEYALFQAGLLS